MAKKELLERIDPSLMRRLSELSPGAQRWLKTAVQSIRTMPAGREEFADDETPPQHLRRREPETREKPAKAKKPAVQEKLPPPSLDDVITGKRKLEEAEQYPELAEELEGLGEIIDMLRGLGESRRKRGEEILREEILGASGPEPGLEEEDEDDDFSF